jgi:predicted alpha/beta-fold hydrolase
MRIRVVLLALAFVVGAPAARADSRASRLDDAVQQILAQPYQAAYVPTGFDTAFADPVPNTAPAQDYTTGSIPGSPDAPAWPAWFRPVQLTSADGAPLLGQLALHPGSHPAVVVAHGFNTHGYASVIRWAAMLYANGYDVLAADQRDFNFEWSAGLGYPAWLQTFGWKESEDVLAAGRYLARQPGVGSVGVVGFSEGAQNAVLALALDAGSPPSVFSAGLTFSGPADQNTQIATTASPPGCATPFCAYPATDALVALVVPPYTNADVCSVLGEAAAVYGTDGFTILGRETAFHAQTRVKVPLLNVYAADDSLVAPFQASMTAAYEAGNPLERTLLLARGEHAYFFDRWWQQRAILLYLEAMLPGASKDATIGTAATVSQTPGGAPAGAQLVPLGAPSRAWADAQLAPYVCDTSRGIPGA